MPKSKKREMVHVYLTPEEKTRTEAEAKKIGISLSSYIKVKLFSKNLAIIFILVVLGSFFSEEVIAAETDLLGLTLDVKESEIDVDNVNITVEIYDATAEEKSVCNSNNNFSRSIVKIKEFQYG